RQALLVSLVHVVAAAGVAPTAMPVPSAAIPVRVAEHMAMPDMPVADPAVTDNDRRHKNATMMESPMVHPPMHEHGVAPHSFARVARTFSAAPVMAAANATFRLQSTIAADRALRGGRTARGGLLPDNSAATAATIAGADRSTVSAAATALHRSATVSST